MTAPPLTPEEIAEAERLAQEQDLLDAQAEEDASNVKMAALEGVFVPSGITRHRGVGPLKIESPRGLISAFSGDLICKLHWPKNPDALPEEWDVVEERIVVSETILAGLLFTCTIPEFPDLLEFRAARIGEARRLAAQVPPEGGVMSAAKAGWDLGDRPKPTQLPASKPVLKPKPSNELPTPPKAEPRK
jgi:hypothetical protein